MIKKFRLYNTINSGLFDLIDGNKETKQTKGLGLLLSKDENALLAFLSIKTIEKAIAGRLILSKIDKLVVNCELFSTKLDKLGAKYRADIVLRFYSDNNPIFAFIIEAKSFKSGISVEKTNLQIENYIDKEVFVELTEFKKNVCCITLTKLLSYSTHEYLVSITWSDIIEAFDKVIHLKKKEKPSELLNDYFNFITNIKGTMKFYEREVFSIPTQRWSIEAVNNLHIYVCPNNNKYQIKQIPLFLAFRESGDAKGAMKNLYKIEDSVILNFSDESLNAFYEDNNYKLYHNKLRDYLKIIKWVEPPADDFQVFLLSEKTIRLIHEPKPKRNNSFRAYYSLIELFDDTLEYVVPDREEKDEL